MRAGLRAPFVGYLTLALALGSPVALFGCESTEELNAANEEAMRQESADVILKTLDGELSRMREPDAAEFDDIAASLDESALTSLSTYQSDAQELLTHIYRRFSYEVKGISISKNMASVVVSVTNVEVSRALQEAHDALVSGEGSVRLKEAYDSGDENQIMRAAMDVVYEKIDTCPETTRELTVILERDAQNHWSVTGDDAEQLRLAVLGGLPKDLVE